MKRKFRILPELQGIVFEQGVKHGDAATWEKVFGYYFAYFEDFQAYTAYLTASTPTEKQQLMSGLAGSKDPELITR